MDRIRKELDDILPAYNQYLNDKIQYQSNELGPEPMLNSFKFVCQELQDFVITLYCGTDTYKERRELTQTLQQVMNKMK